MPEPPLMPPPTSPTAPEFAVTAERLASLKQRLQAISVKHANRRSSQDSLTIQRSTSFGSIGSETEQSVGEPSARTSVYSVDAIKISDGASTVEYDSSKISDGETAIGAELAEPSQEEPQPDASCTCRNVIREDNPQYCHRCGGILYPVARLEKERAQLAKQLDLVQRKLTVMEQRQDASTHEMSKLRIRVHELEEAVATKDQELASVKKDLDRMGQKLIDEVEVRAELQHSKDAVQEELEELTKSLFEEANTMVATEARQRYEYQKKEQTLRHQLEEMTQQLEMERSQLRELRARMEDMDHQQPSAASSLGNMTEGQARLSVYSSISDMGDDTSEGQSTEEAIDPVLFAEFEEFITASADVKLSKMHTLHFMKNALEDDIFPCLRFGGNPRTSTKKLIDAISANTCFVEEMTATQIAALEAQASRFERSKTASPMRSNSQSADSSKRNSTLLPDNFDASLGANIPPAQTKTPPPTQAIFNKTVMERLSSAFSGGTLQLGSSSTLVTNGCSTCGRSSVNSPTCRFQFKSSDLPEDAWCPICVNCRDRLVAVCEFYQFARHIRQGLFSTRRKEDLYLEMLTLKRKMFYARIGATKFSEKDKVFLRKKPRPNSTIVSVAIHAASADALTLAKASDEAGLEAPLSSAGSTASMPKLSFSPLSKRRSVTSTNSAESPADNKTFPVDGNNQTDDDQRDLAVAETNEGVTDSEADKHETGTKLAGTGGTSLIESVGLNGVEKAMGEAKSTDL
ncbi:uncharacterized protein SPPG_08036 [Spizellomyces punctatus DAOM BR117]|uniref:GDP/GTP exchange factor Sec2 N-terminal domain-containing protein n=1 Tax=Spizellomyces punctatus (strain DAOM BR117) TaxID=645134 RepID=A0A0L0H6T1_SPIPD|nr:uncharacterized protein SPPG_08036 [Spizellomyces punctatus DAOM BR117]KNC96443.1 hypothetical protein SPPG_08036 [Spizellomyces punctatus DAOM BR117]|eukprot:XP_016604483.1 hypothetical protein SPPG_08036 [Spizellomyces punctatus DAOM BR117]